MIRKLRSWWRWRGHKWCPRCSDLHVPKGEDCCALCELERRRP